MIEHSSTEREPMLVRGVVESDSTLSELAQEFEMPACEVAQWLTRPQTLRVVQGHALLLDIRAQMLVSRFRASAAAKLISIATSAEPSELSRRACVDLLNADLGLFAALHDPKVPPPPPPMPNADTIAEAMERLGAEDHRTLLDETDPSEVDQ